MSIVRKIISTVEKKSYILLAFFAIFCVVVLLIPPEYYDSAEDSVKGGQDAWLITFFRCLKYLLVFSALVLPVTSVKTTKKKWTHRALFLFGFLAYTFSLGAFIPDKAFQLTTPMIILNFLIMALYIFLCTKLFSLVKFVRLHEQKSNSV